MYRKIAIIGAGGLGKEILSILEACNEERPQFEILGFIVHAQYGAPGTLVNDFPILGGFDWVSSHAHQVEFVCGVGAPQDRLRLVGEARQAGGRFCTVCHPTATLSRTVTLGEGTVLMPLSGLTSSIRIGAHVVVNPGCTIDHDTNIGDFVTLSPGVHIAGHVTIGEGCNIGIGASIIDRRTVGAWSIIGAGAIITNDIPPNVTAVGVPARVIKSRPDAWHITGNI
jgi:sugar O-acyltransferase (sialic acid O-acetyltransferase NeuD family)